MPGAASGDTGRVLSAMLPTEPMRAVLYIAAASGLDEREDIMSMYGDCMRDESSERKETGVGGT